MVLLADGPAISRKTDAIFEESFLDAQQLRFEKFVSSAVPDGWNELR